MGYVAGLLVIDGQMKKCLAVVRTASHRKEHQASLSWKQVNRRLMQITRALNEI
jgi:hypothetical protein